MLSIALVLCDLQNEGTESISEITLQVLDISNSIHTLHAYTAIHIYVKILDHAFVEDQCQQGDVFCLGKLTTNNLKSFNSQHCIEIPHTMWLVSGH